MPTPIDPSQAAGMAGSLAAATPYGAAASMATDAIGAALGGSGPATSSATSGDATSGNATMGDTTGSNQASGITFGGVNLGDSALYSPKQFAAGYTPRRLATGQTAAAMPATPAIAAPSPNQALAYTSTVTATPVGLIVAAVAGLAALVWLAGKK